MIKEIYLGVYHTPCNNYSKYLRHAKSTALNMMESQVEIQGTDLSNYYHYIARK